MRPKWLPQNIQKRLVKYLISRIALFDRLDINDLDVQLGSSSVVVLHNLRLNAEALSIPGIFIRNGHVHTVIMRIPTNILTSPIILELEQVNISASLSASALDEDNFAQDLSKTVSDLAKDFVEQEPTDEVSQLEQSLEGFEEEQNQESINRPGFLSGAVSSIAEALLSQLVVSASDVRVKLAINEYNTSLSIESISFATDKGTRNLQIGSIKIDKGFLADSDEEIDSRSPPSSSSDSSSRSESLDDEDDDDNPNNQLFQSMMFSREEASSIYMSAMSKVFTKEDKQEPTLTTIFYADKLSIALNGPSCHISSDNIRIAALGWPDLLSNLIACLASRPQKDSLKEHPKRLSSLQVEAALESSSPSSLEASNPESLQSSHPPVPQSASLQVYISVTQIHIGLTDFLENSVSEHMSLNTSAESIGLYKIRGSIHMDESHSLSKVHFAMGNIELTARDDDNDIIDGRCLWFKSDDHESEDLILHIEDGITSLNLPNELHFQLSQTAISDLLNAISKISQRDEEPKRDEHETRRHSLLSVSLAKSDIAFINSWGTSRIQISPISYKSDRLVVENINVAFNSSCQLAFNNIVAHLGDGVTRLPERDRAEPEFEPLVQKGRLYMGDIDCHIDLAEMNKLASHISEFIGSCTILSSTGTSSTSSVTKPATTFFDISIGDIVISLKLENFAEAFLEISDAKAIVASSNLWKSSIPDISLQIVPENDNSPFTTHYIISSLSCWRRNRAMVSITQYPGTSMLASLYNVHFDMWTSFFLAVHEYLSENRIFSDTDNNSDDDDDDDTASSIASHQINDTLGDSSSTLRQQLPKRRTANISLRACTVGIHPINLPSHLLLVITDGHAVYEQNNSSKGPETLADLNLRKADLLVIDDLKNINFDSIETAGPLAHKKNNDHIHLGYNSVFLTAGYVQFASLRSSSVTLEVEQQLQGTLHAKSSAPPKNVKIELNNDLLIIESCADSTNTVLESIMDLTQPITESFHSKYRVEVPSLDTFSGISEDFFNSKNFTHNNSSSTIFPVNRQRSNPASSSPAFSFVESYYPERSSSSPRLSTSAAFSNGTDNDDDLIDELEGGHEEFDAITVDEKTSSDESRFAISHEDTSTLSGEQQESTLPLEIIESHFAPKLQSREGRGDEGDVVSSNRKNQEQPADKRPLLSLKVSDYRVVWNLHDGYDWAHTRDVIESAVKKVESKSPSYSQPSKRPLSTAYSDNLPPSPPLPPQDSANDLDNGAGDLLFNSIYVGATPVGGESDLRDAINREIDDERTATLSQTSEVHNETVTENRYRKARPGKRLRLKRSRTHKVQIQLTGINVSLKTYDATHDGEVLSNTNVRIKDANVIDNVSTSTWNKFVTYNREIGERESGAEMLRAEILSVRPVHDLNAAELIIKANILPLRLHVDQDTLDFLARFLQFKSDTPRVQQEQPFVQKFVINPVPVKLDYKPKKVDYAGLRSGHTTEFMNFFILEGSEMILRGASLYGVSGFTRLGQMLNDIWMPDIKSTQLGDVLAGLANIRSIVKIGGGFRDLVYVPITEYRRDRRLLRSIQKGATTFTKTTSTELFRLGAKLAVGSHNFLEGTERFMRSDQTQDQSGQQGFIDNTGTQISNELDEEVVVYSPYSDQPLTVTEGLQRAYNNMRINLEMARSALRAVPEEASDSGSARGAMLALARAAPIAVLRPMMGTSKAVSDTLQGLTNQLDPQQRRNDQDKYKRQQQQ